MDAKFWEDACAYLDTISDEEWMQTLEEFDRRHPIIFEIEIEQVKEGYLPIISDRHLVESREIDKKNNQMIFAA